MSDRPVTLVGVCIDGSDGSALANFYAGLLGWEITANDGDEWFQLRDPDGGVGLNIQQEAGYRPPVWPEKSGEQQKMMHFEVEVVDLDDAVDLALRLGGSEASFQPPDRDQSRIRVMLDPAGHPLCLFLHGE